jgi:hypothetical protein
MKLKFPARVAMGTVIMAGSLALAQSQPTTLQASNSAPEAANMAAAPSPTPAPQASTQSDRSPSDAFNEHMPKWLRFSGEIRLRGEGFTGAGFKPDDGTGYMLSRVRLNMRVQPTSWMTFMFQGQDSHILGEDEKKLAPLPPYQDTFDLRQAYLEFGDVEKRNFGFRLGRQELAFGSERLLGNANWLNTPRSFDGFRATYRGSSYRLDGFAACMDKIHDGQFNECVFGSNIYGFYSTFTKLVPKTSIEPFFFWRRQSALKTEEGVTGIMNYGTVGFHWSVKPATALDYDVEMARQAGSLGSDTISAWAGHWLVGYTLASVRYKPRFMTEFNYATGDHGVDGTRGTFDQIYPSGHDLYGLVDQVGWKNIEHVRGGVELKPTAKWKIGSKYSSYWLADTHDALYSAASTALAKSAAGTAGKWVGQELDFTGSYSVNKRTVLSGGFGHLFPGTFLRNTTPHVGYTYPYVQVVYGF